MEQRARKPLEELTLLDRFLFAETMDQPENLQILLEIILGKKVLLKELPQTEKEIRKSSLNRYIRLDVWGMDEDGAVYDTEVQKRDTKNLRARSRYYQAVIDSRLLEPGTVDFNKMNPVYIISIAPFDLFGFGRYRYTFEQVCREIPSLRLEDKGVRIFLNTHGTNEEEEKENPELVQLLKFMERTNDSAMATDSKRILRLRDNVRKIQNNAEIGVKYMQAWEERVLDRQEARAEGKAEGKAEGLSTAVLDLLEVYGAVPEKLRLEVTEEQNVEQLRLWLRLAAGAGSMEEFIKKYKASIV